MGSAMKDDELLERAKAEREKIFERYDKGRAPDNTIEEWEDADFPLYYQTDRWVFILSSLFSCSRGLLLYLA